MEAELKALLQTTGDAVAALIKQMLKGEWTDDMGHKVSQNVAMQDMTVVLQNLMEFRAKHLGYTAPGTGGSDGQ